jgi:hypothetical protein
MCKPSIKIISNLFEFVLKNSSLVFFIVPPLSGSTPTLLSIFILEKQSSLKHPISK